MGSTGAPPGHRNANSSGPSANAEELRKHHLERLKDRWLALKSPNDATGIDPVIYEARQALAKESAELLLCSSEAIELLVFLNRNGGGDMLVSAYIKSVLETPKADEALALLAGLPGNLASEASHYPQSWAMHAGLVLPSDKLDGILPKIGNKDVAQEMMIGRNVALSKTDPQAAILSILGIIEDERATANRMDSLKKVMDHLPSGVEYPRILELLPATRAMDEDTPITRALPSLLGKWAEADPAAAANFLIANPDRNNEYVMGAVVEVVSKNDPWRGVDWVQSFPEGPVFDTAARTAARWIAWDHPDEARKLAGMIEDPRLRLEALQSIQDAQGEKAGGH